MGKRLQNEGSVYQRKDGRWVAQVVIGTRNGRPVRKYKYCESADASRKALTELLSRLDKGETVSTDAISLKQYAERWQENVRPDLKTRTMRSYEQLLRLHILPALGKKKIRDIRRADVRAFLNRKRAEVIPAKPKKSPAAGNAERNESKAEEPKQRPRHLSKNTIRLIRACLSALFSDAVEDGLVAINPAQGLPRRHGRKRAENMTVQERAKGIRPFSESEVKALLTAAREDDYYPVFLLLIRTGMRPGEAYGLKWDDLDFEKRTILVERALAPDGVGTTKTGGVRHADMSLELAETLKKLRVTRQKQKLKLGCADLPEWVFSNDEGNPLDESRVRKHFKTAMRKANLSGHKLYDCRHTYATLLLAKGAPITYVAAQLGHAKPNTTLQYYARWLPGADCKYVDALDAADAGPNGSNPASDTSAA